MTLLPRITLICIDCCNYSTAILALRKSMQQCEFYEVKLLTDVELKEDGIEVVIIPRINSKEQYSEFCIKELYKYFNTDFIMVVQHDGYVISWKAWEDEFMDYDYTAPKWLYTDGKNVGCGGASLRSKKLQTILGTDDFIFASDPEDQSIGRLYRDYLIKKYEIKFSPESVADRFGYELNAPYCDTFCFHGYFHQPFKKHIVLKRTASLGDVIMMEAIVSYYSEQGYQVVIDTLIQFMEVFSRYRHRVIHISQMDARIVPIKTISFDMCYENKPKQLVLKSYIELTGEDIPLRNSQLDFPVAKEALLFEKYILIHADDTGMEHRNQHGINWKMVYANYNKLGFQVFQIGKRMKEQVAPYINSANLETLMFLIKGASLVIAIDSSPLQIAVALGIPAIGFFGSVNPEFRYLPTDKLVTLHSPCVKKEDDFCYHNEVGTTGIQCQYDTDVPPCTIFDEYKIIRAANKLLKLN